MRTRFSSRALAATLAMAGLAMLRTIPAGSGHELPLNQEPTIAAAATLPAAAQDVSYANAPASSASPALTWPGPSTVTSPFGGSRHHPGVDLKASTGDAVKAAGAGTVLLAGMAPAGYAGYGNIVLVDHGGGIATLYAHLSRVDVAMGQTVQQGQQIGAVGMTGMATGPHLHFEVRVNGTPEDPVPFLPPPV
ncbi:MAG: M23 family metallopeptidase [Acidimicrobiia bacterium]|nr:M23 family metallopeptidase [Acidimicrobiia bacterium]